MILPPDINNHHKELDFCLNAALSGYDTWHTVDECIRTFSIVSKTARVNLDHYFLLYWDVSHFLEQLTGPDKSYITRNGIRYYVIYMELLSPEYVKEYEQVRVSFRKPKQLTFGFVLVRSIPNKVR